MTSDPPENDPLAGDKYLPGLEGDPESAVLENWTNTDFDRWFTEEIDGSSEWAEFLNQHRAASSLPGVSIDPAKFANDPFRDPSDFEAALEALARQASSTTADGRLVIDPSDFSRLARETKAAFLEGWYQPDRSSVLDRMRDEQAEEAEEPPTEANRLVTTPPGGIHELVPDEADDPLPGLEPEYEDEDRAAAEPVTAPASDEVDERVDYRVETPDQTAAEYFGDGPKSTAVPQTSTSTLKNPLSIIGDLVGCGPVTAAVGTAAAATAGVLLFMALGGGGADEPEAVATSSPSVVASASPSAGDASAVDATADGSDSSAGAVAVFAADDDTDDIGPQADDLTAIEDPNLAGDIIKVSAEVNAGANETQLMMWFAGDAQTLQTSTGTEFGTGVLIRPPDGSRGLDIIHRNNGSSKISDPPAGVSLSVDWVQPDMLMYTIPGYTTPAGSTIEFQTFQTENFAFSSDIATLITDEDHAD